MRQWLGLPCAVAALLLTGCSRHKSAALLPVPRYTVVKIGDIGTEGYAKGLNNKGQVVGRIGDNIHNAQAFIWTKGKLTRFGPVGGLLTGAYSINDSEQVVGTADPFGDYGGNQDAFVCQRNHVLPLKAQNFEARIAEAINNKGEIVGEAMFGRHGPVPFFSQNDRDYELAGGGQAMAVNNSGQIAGSSYGNAVVWLTKTSSPTILGPDGEATAINRQGEVVGYSKTSTFIWRHGALESLAPLMDNQICIAFGINNKGQVVGNSAAVDLSQPLHRATFLHACLWQNGQVYDLNSLLTNPPKELLSGATAVNDRGQILAVAGVNGQYHHAYLLTPTK